MTDSTTQPVRQQERIGALDVLRGFALCGVLLMNIPAMGDAWDRYWPALPATTSNPDWIAWLATCLYVEGTARGLFTLLFGAGMLLMTRAAPGADGPISAADIFLRRSFALLGLGLVNVLVFLWPGDILYVYGAGGFVLFAFRRARPATLIVLGLVLMTLIGVPRSIGAYHHAQEYRAGAAAAELKARGQALTPAQARALEARDAAMARINPVKADLDKETTIRRGGFAKVAAWSWTQWSSFMLTPFGPLIIGESVAFMMVGMALFRLDVLTGRRPLRVYVALAALGYGVGFAIRAWTTWRLWSTGFTPLAWESRALYVFGRLPVTLGHVGLILALWKLDVLGIVGRGMAALGQMALSNYLGQSVLTSVLFYGFRLYGRFSLVQLCAIAAVILIAQTALSAAWLRRFRFGPMEWLLRSVAYGAGQPLRRRPDAVLAPSPA